MPLFELLVSMILLSALGFCSTLVSEAYGSYSPSYNQPPLYDSEFSAQPDRILRVSAVTYFLDCIFRYSIVINGTVPGPELRFRAGDKVWIRVYNDLTDSNITMHWHGLTQRMSPYADGTPLLSQWPIPPLRFFDYKIQLQPNDAGTYFYHTHVGPGHVTATAALIIEERNIVDSPFDYDEERVLFFTDVFHADHPQIEDDKTYNIALNGRSRSDNATENQACSSCSYGVISIQPDRTYRFRLIGGTVLSQVYFAFEGHSKLTLIEVDGNYVSPLEVSNIQIHSGQRYSVLLKSKTLDELKEDRTRGKSQYWIQMETRGLEEITTSYAVLAYDINGPPDTFTKPVKKPLVLPAETLGEGWLEDDLKPLHSHPYEDTFPQLSEITRRIVINVQSVIINKSETWLFNGFPFFENSPVEPYLVSLYKNNKKNVPSYEAALANHGRDPKTQTYPAKLGEVLEIVWQNLGDSEKGETETHPLHAHGDHFWDAGSGSGPYDELTAETILRNRIRNGGPIKRDTTNLYRAPPSSPAKPGEVVSWRAWRIRVKNPGVWMVHCHILQHMMMGMQTVFVFGEREDLVSLPKDLAETYLDYGG